MSLSDVTDRPPTLTSITNNDEHEQQHQITRASDVTIEHEQLNVDTNAVVEEKDLIGQVVEGTDGEYYLVTPNDDNGDVGIDEISHVKIMVGSDGSRLYVVDNEKDENSQQSQEQQQQQSNILVEQQNQGQEQQIQVQQAPSSSDSSKKQQNQNETRDASFQPGTKGRRNRVYGACRCPECGQTFVNTARLERHLAVHQIFGSFVCPLCSKTYKYEYNLFYHWRKTCRDLDEVFTHAERKDLDVNTLRSAVDDLVKKKRDYHQIAMGKRYFSRFPRLERLAVPVQSMTRRSMPCRACGVAIILSHMNTHLNLHRGIGLVGDPDQGCYFCDLCGLMFRQYPNLIRHWKVSCPEIQANIPNAEDLDEISLKSIVTEMMKTVVCEHGQIGLMSPQQAILREKARQYDSTTGDLDYTGNNEETIQRYEYEDVESYVYTDDLMDDDMSMISRSEQIDQNKWINGTGMPVQCTECKRAFANVGRLERHMAGYHSSFGSHHCPLCGNRFKYDYNLLYHYRRSCPYTKSFIETEMRQQLDAQTLRKLVRSLAQKDLRVINSEMAQQSTSQKDEYGDMSVRREMLGRETIKNLPQIPPNKPGIPEGKNCPLCGITFYGLPVLSRHVRAAHPRDSYLFDPETGLMKEGTSISTKTTSRFIDGRPGPPRPPHFADDEVLDASGEGDLDGDDMPPELEKVDNTIHHDEGPLHLCDAQGRIISQVQDLNEFQALVDSGQLDLRPNDRFMLMDSNQIVHSELIYEDSRFIKDPPQTIYYQQYEEMEEDLEKPIIESNQHQIMQEHEQSQGQHHGMESQEIDDGSRQAEYQEIQQEQHEYTVPQDVAGPSNMSMNNVANNNQEQIQQHEVQEEFHSSPRRSPRKRQSSQQQSDQVLMKVEPEIISESTKRTRRNTRASPQKGDQQQHLSPRRSLRNK